MSTTEEAALELLMEEDKEESAGAWATLHGVQTRGEIGEVSITFCFNGYWRILGSGVFWPMVVLTDDVECIVPILVELHAHNSLGTKPSIFSFSASPLSWTMNIK